MDMLKSTKAEIWCKTSRTKFRGKIVDQQKSLIMKQMNR